MEKKTVIVIPIYKEQPNQNELTSIFQCFKILKDHTIVFIHPKKMNLSRYKNTFGSDISVQSFDNEFFTSVAGYNKLLLHADFYNRFVAFDYLLVYQTDSYIFYDDLATWTQKGFHYIGAIWFEGFTDNPESGAEITMAGNGGFSLRHIGMHLELLQQKKPLLLQIASWKHLLKTGNKKTFKLFLKWGLTYYSLANLSKKYSKNEDVFFWQMSCLFPQFKMAKASEALLFAWDRRPDYLLKQTGQLPMACHAWDRSDFPYAENAKFWQQFITLHP